MALKAGRVGVNPSQVDMAGNVIGAGGDTYTKLEIDQMLGSKVGIGQLEANDKDFYFAYDSTTQKYGYKLDNTGDFHPFESGGIPFIENPSTTGIELDVGGTSADLEILEGGYEIVDDSCVIFIKIHNGREGTSNMNVKFPVVRKNGSNADALLDIYSSTDFDFPECPSIRSTGYASTQGGKTIYNIPGTEKYLYLIGVIIIA